MVVFASREGESSFNDFSRDSFRIISDGIVGLGDWDTDARKLEVRISLRNARGVWLLLHKG